MKTKTFTDEYGTSLNLRACPFCGGLNFEFTSKQHFDDIVQKTGSCAILISCIDCTMDFWIMPHAVADEFNIKASRDYNFMIRLAEKKFNTRRRC